MEDIKLHLITKLSLDITTKINFLSNFPPTFIQYLYMEGLFFFCFFSLPPI